MTIDAKKMQAFVKQGPKSGGKGGPPPNAGAKKGDDADGQKGGEEEGGGAEQEGDEPKFSNLLRLLEQHGQDIEACVEELDPEQLVNFGEELSDADKQILKQGFDDMEQAVVDEGKHVLPGITEEEADKLGQHLEGEGAVQDGHVAGAWLFRVGEMLDSSDEGDSEDSEDGGDDSEEEGDSEDGGAGDEGDSED